MTKKKTRLWSKSGRGDYLFCTCDCTDYKMHSDVQQSKSEFMSRWRNTVRPGDWASIGHMDDYAACLFGRTIGLVRQTLASGGWLAWRDQDGCRHLITQSHKRLQKRASKQEEFELEVENDPAMTIDACIPSKSGKMLTYEIRTFHEVMATLNHSDVVLWCCKHIIVATRFLFAERWPTVPFRIGWGLAQEDVAQKLMLNGQVAVAAMPERGF